MSKEPFSLLSLLWQGFLLGGTLAAVVYVVCIRGAF